METQTIQIVEQKLQKIQELFEQNSPNNWYIDDNIKNWFSNDEINTKPNINSKLGFKRLEKGFFASEMSSNERIVKLLISQALDIVINIVENLKDSTPDFSNWILIESSNECVLHLWYTVGAGFNLGIGERRFNEWFPKGINFLHKL